MSTATITADEYKKYKPLNKTNAEDISPDMLENDEFKNVFNKIKTITMSVNTEGIVVYEGSTGDASTKNLYDLYKNAFNVFDSKKQIFKIETYNIYAQLLSKFLKYIYKIKIVSVNLLINHLSKQLKDATILGVEKEQLQKDINQLRDLVKNVVDDANTLLEEIKTKTSDD